PQATWWTTWSGTEGGAEDGIVSTEQAASGTKSVKLVSTSTSGGPQDVVLNLGTKSTGRYSLKWKMYIPLNKKAYYNIQDIVPIPASPATENWNLDVSFEANGAARGSIEGVNKFAFTFPYAKWFTVEHIVDLDNNVLTYLVDGKVTAKTYFDDRLGGIDFYCIDNTHQFYVDDVEYVTLPAVVQNADICSQAVDLTPYFGGTAGVTQTTPSYNNTTATPTPYDPAIDCWSETAGADLVDNSLWFTFVGDGKRYRIETDSCSAAFITDGDTQMAIFEGNDCFNLSLAECNDDIDAQNGNYRSGIEFETVAGQNYYILVDGYNLLGNVAKGEFCLKITQKASITCAQGEVGTFTLDNNGALCFGQNLTDLLTVDAPSFIIPNEGPLFGMAWVLSANPLDPAVWPGTLPNSEAVYTRLIPNVIEISLPNDGSTGFQPGVYYLSPVVAGGAEAIDPSSDLFLDNINVDNGCFYIGESKPFLFLPELNDIGGTTVVTDEVAPPGNNGKIDLSPTGGFPELAQDPSLYIYQWNNGQTTQDLSNLAAGTYTVTITDPTNCAAPAVITVIVKKTTDTQDPATVKSLNVTPNPTTGIAQLSISLENASELRYEVSNTLGQVLQAAHMGKVSSVNQPLDLSTLSAGTYFLRVWVDGETAIRRVVVQK
ncbi:MAG TPA: T9SS type A sorting domain-containing protein, partial [Saprospiraceae bacterium]|nr:T9SS type A sorting domain-containing protein [Saprospiraceae bacterium]